MKKNAILGLSQILALEPLILWKILAGRVMLIGSLVLGLLNPMNFLRVFLKDRSTSKYRKATEHY
jgi:hypothetical protein